MLSEIIKSKGVLIIAEVGQAHEGSLGFAHYYIDAAAKAGADIVKFQTHMAHAESTMNEPWRVKFSYEDEYRYDYWKRMEFTEEQWAGLKKHAEEKGLMFMSTPFSLEAAELLDRIGISIWKVSSGEVNDPWLMEKLLSTGKPIIFSTGMSTMEAICNYAAQLEKKKIEYAILQCTSMYPVLPKDVGLNVIDDLKKKYQVPIGLSDHSGTIYPALAAVSRGASIIEAHICMSKNDFGPDVKASLTVEEFQKMTEGVRAISEMLANPVDKDKLAGELSRSSQIFSKSVCAKRRIEKGEILTRDMLILKKPCIGIPAKEVETILGKKVTKAYEQDEFIERKYLEDEA